MRSKKLPNAWLETLREHSKEVVIVRLYAFQLFSCLVEVCGLLLLLAFLYVMKKQSYFRDKGVQLAISFFLIGGCYLSTFIPFTMSATESRYFAPHSSLFAVGLAIFSLYVINRFVLKRAPSSSIR